MHKSLLAGLLIFCLYSCHSEDEWVQFEDPIFVTILHDDYGIPLTSKGRIDMNDEATRVALREITALELRNAKCLNLIGIKHMPNLVSLACDGNRLTSLDVSGMDRLRTIDCWRNQLQTLNIQGCKSLLSLICHNQTDNNDQTLQMTLIMSPDQKPYWEKYWKPLFKDVIPVFKE